MDEILNQVLEACRLARELELSLGHIANNPAVLLASCEQVSGAWKKAVEELRGILGGCSGSFDPVRLMEEWGGLAHFGESMGIGQVGFGQMGMDVEARVDNREREFVGYGGGREFAGGEVEAEAGGRLGRASTGQRTSRTRREKGETRTVKLPAVHTGNLELPPDDGYTWRKYGQKVILGSRFPRSYFRCTHKNFYGCKAKRKVQKLDADPNMYEITYCGNHTCHTSPTPLILPSIAPTGNDNTLTNITGGMTGPSPTPAVSSWFLQESETEEKALFRPFLSSHEVGESSRPHVPPLEQAPPVRLGREGYGSVTDLADVMFNSGSSSNNSIDTIFSYKKDK